MLTQGLEVLFLSIKASQKMPFLLALHQTACHSKLVHGVPVFLTYSCFICKSNQLEGKLMLVTSLSCIIAKSLPVLELQDRDLHVEGLHIVNRPQKEKMRDLV